MSLLDSLYDAQTWEEYKQYKISHGHISPRRQKELEEYIRCELYLPTAKDLCFSPPEKKTINKSGTQKKRVIYMFPPQQTRVLKLLTYLLYKYDGAFCKSCYSFRKGITAKKAMQDIMGLKNKNSCWVMKLDIHNYFNSMPSKKLVKEFERVITDDPRLLDFLTQFFTADVSLSDGHRITEDRGAMAGMPLSAFCANLYLTDLDRLFEKMGVPYFRYSDDILIFAPSRSLAMQYYQIIKQHIENKGLTLNNNKFSLTPPGDPWEFLGFKYHNGEIDLSQTSIDKMKAKIKRKAAAIYRRKCRQGTADDKAAKNLIRTFDRKFFAPANEKDFTWSRWFFPVITTHKGLEEIDRYLVKYIRYTYTGRHYKGNYKISYEHLKSLGLRSLVNEYYKYRNDIKTEKG